MKNARLEVCLFIMWDIKRNLAWFPKSKGLHRSTEKLPFSMNPKYLFHAVKSGDLLSRDWSVYTCELRVMSVFLSEARCSPCHKQASWVGASFLPVGIHRGEPTQYHPRILYKQWAIISFEGSFVLIWKSAVGQDELNPGNVSFTLPIVIGI